ncbi:hypothetical protein ACQJBY_041286 [Aegilops geniculata]
MVKASDLFKDNDKAALMRIEILVVVIAAIFLLMSFLDMFRRQRRHSAIKYLLLVLDAISDSSFIYAIGLMQSAPFKNDMFSIWALILVNLRYNACFISAYGIPDTDNSRIAESTKVMALLGVAFLIGTQNSQFKHPIWVLWVMQQVRSIYLMLAYNRAIRSFLHGWSSPLLTAYMSTGEGVCTKGDPTTMVAYKYLVSGDQKQKVKLQAPGYKFYLKVKSEGVFITLDKTWQLPSDPHLGICARDVQTSWTKDLCLSFALYRLLRCRFDDLPLPVKSIKSTRKLMYEIIGKNSRDLSLQRDHRAERAFRIAKLELPHLALIAWLGRDIHKLYKPKEGGTTHIIHGFNVDLIITWIFMGIIVLKESWKVVTYLLSDWTKVMLLCEYTSRTLKCIPQWLWELLVRTLCTPRCTLVHRWHNKIGQYEFLQSFDHNPWNIPYWLSLGLVPKEIRGAKLGSPTELPAVLKAAILKSLCSLDLEQNSLKSDLPTDLRQFDWTFKLRTWCRSILVWHIATSLCELELARRYNTSLTTRKLLRSIQTAFNCFCSQPYVIREDTIEGAALRADYIAANSISRYCAYLLVEEPDLLPDSFLTADDIFRSTVDEASDILIGCDGTLESIYTTLIQERVPQQDSNASAKRMERSKTHPNMILANAARLACSLIHEIPDEVVRWKVLAEVWADILVHTAPSWNASAHKKCLATGSEFITHIWVILSHCNIQSSKRWPYEEPPHDDDNDDNQGAEPQGNGAQAPQEPTVGGDELLAHEVLEKVPSNGAGQEEDQTRSPTPGQHLTTNGQQLARDETEDSNEIQEVGADLKG